MNETVQGQYTYDGDGRRLVRQVNGATTWQVTGFGGELLAEYAASSVTILPQKEYGYHGGQLLITASSGDENRLRRFVENIYYRTWGYLPEGGRKQASINALVATLGQNGQPSPSAMLTEARRQLDVAFTAAPYTNTTRPHEQFVADLYLAYLQRAPEPGAIAWYAAFLHSNQLTPLQLRQEFAASGEFVGLVNALYGMATDDYTRVDNLVAQVYLAATGDNPSLNEATAARVRFDEAEAQGSQVTIAVAQELGRYLLGANAHGANGQPLPAYRSDLGTTEYVRRLYETFLRRAPDAQAGTWQTQAEQQGRQSVLEAFLAMSAYRERGAALYQEIQWLVSDHLGTPRLIAERTGSAAGIKRSDYLPFGESANTLGGRTAGQGYGGDNVRQGFTGHEEDAETGLSYAQARYLSVSQGRFVSVDPLLASGKVDNPQTWNRYAYVGNNPLVFTDPTGEDWYYNKGENNYKWADSSPGKTWEAVKGGGFSYYAGEKWGYIALDPHAAYWSHSFSSKEAAQTQAEAWNQWGPEQRAVAGELDHMNHKFFQKFGEYSLTYMSGVVSVFGAGLGGGVAKLGLAEASSAQTARQLPGALGRVQNWYNRGSENDVVWSNLPIKDRFFYDIGSKTLSNNNYARFSKLGTVEAGKAMWAEGRLRAFLPSGRGYLLGAGRTFGTGPTPAFRFTFPFVSRAITGVAAAQVNLNFGGNQPFTLPGTTRGIGQPPTRQY